VDIVDLLYIQLVVYDLL